MFQPAYGLAFLLLFLLSTVPVFFLTTYTPMGII